MITQAISREFDRTNAASQAREQNLTTQLADIVKEQANARERENQAAIMMRENRQASEKMLQTVSQMLLRR